MVSDGGDGRVRKTVSLGDGRIGYGRALCKFPFDLKMCAEGMIKTPISVGVENRQETLVLWRTPRGGGTDGRQRGASPFNIGLMVLSPIRVRRRVFNVLHGRTNGEPPETIEWALSRVLSTYRSEFQCAFMIGPAVRTIMVLWG